MNDSKNSSNGLLVLRYPQDLTQKQSEDLHNAISPLADSLGVEALVLGSGGDARIETGSSALLQRICVALEEIAAQGRMPEVNVAEIAPQALNARPTGLNSRPVNPSQVNVVEDSSKAGLSQVRTLADGSEVLDVFVRDLSRG
jgi:hypothetical protein